MTGDTRDSVDVRSLVCEPRRRLVLSLLLERQRVTLDLVTLSLATSELLETDADPERRPPRVAVSLVHNHLPRLADHDLLEYDARSGDIVRTRRFEAFRSTIEYYVAAACEPQSGEASPSARADGSGACCCDER
ncbi:DUF7344 domain-containing protein [Natronobiforma cellulositropha]|uniref:DUF7344 domain-containing protein n=1 Tax=Natronobiforma cellulositropha TaxID=1679076 RepID=UPI0021D611C7|nr:hypothetical protein [Natronobiforma cellulositropha]